MSRRGFADRALPVAALLAVAAIGWMLLRDRNVVEDEGAGRRSESPAPRPSLEAPALEGRDAGEEESAPPAPEPAPSHAEPSGVVLHVHWDGIALEGVRWVLPPVSPTRSGRTDRGGETYLGPEAVAAWKGQPLRLAYDGFASARIDRPTPLPARMSVALEPQRELATIEGVVTDERGVPLSGAIVGGRGPGPFARASTDFSGRFQLVLPLAPISPEFVPPDPKVYASAAGFLAQEIPLTRSGAENLVIRMEPDRELAAVVLRFVDAVGDPLPWVRGQASSPEAPSTLGPPQPAVVLTDALAWERHEYERHRAHFSSGADGVITLPSRRPGPLHVDAFQGELFVHAVIDVRSPPDRTDETLRLLPGRIFVGRLLVDADPTWRCDHARHEWTVRADFGEPVRTDADGTFRIALPKRAVEIRADTEGHPFVTVKLEDGPPPRSGAPTDLGTILVSDARPLSGTLRYGDGTSVRMATIAWIDGGRTYEELVDGGRFTLRIPRPTGAACAVVHVDGRRVTISGPFDLERGTLDLRIDDAPPR